MSVDSVQKIAHREIGDNDKPTIKAQETFLVHCTNKTDGPEIALLSSEIPVLWSLYTFSYQGQPYGIGGLVAKSRDCSFKEITADGGCLYEIVVNYDTDVKDPDQKDPNPLNRNLRMWMTFDSFEETRYQAPTKPKIVDANGANQNALAARWPWGKAICNSAGRPFDPSIMDQYRDPVVTIKLNMAAIPWDFMRSYKNAVNSDFFTIRYRQNNYPVAPGQAWLFEVTTDPQYENGIQYEEVTVTVKIRDDGWGHRILDAGLEGTTLEPATPQNPGEPFRDMNGDPIQQPCCLDGTGISLGSQEAHGAVPIFLQWNFKDMLPFANLPFWS